MNRLLFIIAQFMQLARNYSVMHVLCYRSQFTMGTHKCGVLLFQHHPGPPVRRLNTPSKESQWSYPCIQRYIIIMIKYLSSVLRIHAYMQCLACCSKAGGLISISTTRMINSKQLVAVIVNKTNLEVHDAHIWQSD